MSLPPKISVRLLTHFDMKINQEIRIAAEAATASAAGESYSPPRVPAHFHGLLQLPILFWSRMHLYLDYVDILNLAQLSSEFHSIRVEKFLPWAVRHRIVAKMDASSALISQMQCACYLCFRIKSIENFQKPSSMVMFARVLERDAYTGERRFVPVSPPSPGQVSSIVQPPPMPASPIGMGTFLMGARIGDGGSVGSALAIRHHVAIPWAANWRPQAPGAEVGQIESLRTYCIDCALETGLATPGDMIETRAGRKLWVCDCRIVREQDADQRCLKCGMCAVYR